MSYKLFPRWFSQIRERECQNVSENIALIRLQQDKKAKATQISTLEAQLQVSFTFR